MTGRSRGKCRDDIMGLMRVVYYGKDALPLQLDIYRLGIDTEL